jgi:tetratricopeptide (TPR) repeat protein
MNKRKIKIIALILLLLSLPIGYIVVLSISIDTQNRDLVNAIQTNFKIKPLVEEAIESTNRAIFWKPWDKVLRQNRLTLLMEIQDYNQALIAIQDDLKVLPLGDNYAREGLIYEYLGEKDKAKGCYLQAIKLYRDVLKENPNSDYYLAETATLLMIVGDTNEVRTLLSRRKVGDNTVNQEMINRQNGLILSYKSGGLLWFVDYAKKHY